MIDPNHTFIIWPQRRFVPEHEMWKMYDEAVANGQIPPEYLFAHDIQIVRQALAYAGVIVLGETF